MPWPIRTALILVLTVAVLVLLLWLFQRRLVYFPAGDPGTAPPGWEAVSATTTDGIDLRGWVTDGVAGQPIVIVFHGNAGNRGGRLPLGRALAAHGYGVVMFDYRGYGGNEGRPTEEGLQTDARAVWGWARDRYPGRRLIVFGESIGAAVATGLAVQHPPSALILRSPFTSLADVASHHYPFLPVGVLLRDEFPVVEQISSVDAPVTVVAGSADRTVPWSQSLAVFDAAATHATWVLIEGADHNDPELSHGPAVVEAIRDAAE